MIVKVQRPIVGHELRVYDEHRDFETLIPVRSPHGQTLMELLGGAFKAFYDVEYDEDTGVLTVNGPEVPDPGW